MCKELNKKTCTKHPCLKNEKEEKDYIKKIDDYCMFENKNETECSKKKILKHKKIKTCNYFFEKDHCHIPSGSNTICQDCSGQLNGHRKIDKCGECKHPRDETFNECINKPCKI